MYMAILHLKEYWKSLESTIEANVDFVNKLDL